MIVGRGRGRTNRARHFLARRRDQRGNALVEAVIIIPVLMLITFGGIEFGIGFSQKGALESASRAGAREGATLTNDQTAPLSTAIGDKVLQSVNAALDTTAVPALDKLTVYKAGTSPNCVVTSTTCISYLPGLADTKHFDATRSTGSWPYLDPLTLTPTRQGCVPLPGTPDKISVQVEGHFEFLTGLVGHGTIPLKVSSTLQFEPTESNC